MRQETGFGTRWDERNIFEQLFLWMERLRSEGQYRFGLEELVSAVERLLQDASDSALSAIVMHRLSYWHQILTRAQNAELEMDAFRARLESLVTLLVRAHNPDARAAIKREIEKLEPAPPEMWFYGGGAITGASATLAGVFAGGTIQVSDAFVNTVRIALSNVGGKSFTATLAEAIKEPVFLVPAEDDRDRAEIRAHAKHVWTIDVRLHGGFRSAKSIGRLLWVLGEALETVDGVIVDVEDIGKGSLWARLRIFIKETWRRDEVQSILDLSRRGITAQHLEKPIQEVERLKAEARKLEEETATLAHQRELLPELQDASAHRQLDLESKKLEVEDKRLTLDRRRLENDMLRLQLVEKAADLVRTGIILADPVRVDINGLPYVTVSSRLVQPGATMQDIAAAESQPKPDQPAED